MNNSLLLLLPNTFRAFYGAFASLHNAQRESIVPILSGRDLVLQAATGSGKSEAVLAPCLERVITSGRKTAVLYIIPTRALAMDLKRRFESVITERLGLNLAIRTGDIKRAGGRRPDIMFTTPESFDVMLGSANPDLKSFLARVSTIIIDEVHPLIHQYRGQHLVYLLIRLERRTGRRLQKIAMSATIARVKSVIDFFGFQTDTQHITTSVNRKIDARLLHMKKEEIEIPALLNDLYDTWHYRKILVFANSRSACDRLFGIVSRTGRFSGVSELHYSNLKPLERKNTEKRFRKKPCALCIATSTLELGIDVGDVDAVLLYEPPGSVSAFLQRIGRANRREKQINFWGLCCGEASGAQVIRFLALLDLARRGIIESAGERKLLSVLSQQVISCLYEKKRISLPSMQSLFPEHHDILPSVFASLENKKWLKKSKIDSMTRGGWQYRNHLFNYKIWGNFPESEEEYVLYVSDKAIADIPQSTVSQMEAGDKVYMVGRLLKIVAIDTGEQKKIMAIPATGHDEKQLAWVGCGIPVSYELSQAMAHILNTGEIEDETCLFNRTKKLLLEEINQGKKKVVLKNGIEVVPGKKAAFYYRTFIGSAGNFVLEWSIRDRFADDDDLMITSDSMGIECSHWIRFDALALPVTRLELQNWVRLHSKILGSLVPLNMFCKTLPEDLRVEELTSFLFDPRVARTLSRYRNTSSEIVSGDRAALVLKNSAISNPVPKISELCAIDIIPGAFLLDSEKQKGQGQKEKEQLFFDSDSFESRHFINFTGAMISDYFFHNQCPRQFYFNFFNPDYSCFISAPVSNNDTFESILPGPGIAHKKQVLRHLQKQGDTIFKLPDTGSYDFRFNVFLDQLRIWIKKLMSGDIDENTPGSTSTVSTLSTVETPSVFLSRCMLKANDLNTDNLVIDNINNDSSWSGSGEPDRLDGPLDESESNSSGCDALNIRGKLSDNGVCHHLTINGMGVPDLLILSMKEVNGKRKIVIEPGDIIRGTYPGYHHKWKVAFYALLLEEIINCHDIPAIVAETGFFITRSAGNSVPTTGSLHEPLSFHEPLVVEKQVFDLKAYLSVFPVLFKTLSSTLSLSASAKDYRLQAHCVSCTRFFYCYNCALEKEEIQFLPGLTSGELFKLRQMGCSDIAQTRSALEMLFPENHSDPGDRSAGKDVKPREYLKYSRAGFTLEQKKKLLGNCRAFMENRIFMHKKNTRLFPDNISAAFFIYIRKDPLTGQPSSLGLQVVDSSKPPMEAHVWIIKNNEDRKEVWHKFSGLIANLWGKSITNGKGPHIFHFGSNSRQDILQWGDSEGGEKPEFLWQTQPCPWTDLRRVFKAHFYMPAPGIVSLFTLSHVFGCHTQINTPATLFHYHESEERNLLKTVTAHSQFGSCRRLQGAAGARRRASKRTNVLQVPANGAGAVPCKHLLKTEPPGQETMVKSCLSVMVELYEKARSCLTSQWTQEWDINLQNKAPIHTCLRFIREEKRLQEDEILTLQELTLRERMLRFRAIGYLRFHHTRLDHEGRFLYIFKTSEKTGPSKFRKGDFVRLAPHDILDIQNGFPVIMVDYNTGAGEISLLFRSNPLSGKMHLSKDFLYSIEEDISDWTGAKLIHAANAVFAGEPFGSSNLPDFSDSHSFSNHSHSLYPLLTGQALDSQPIDSLPWLEKWLINHNPGLNTVQKEALALPFQYRTSMIQGPPGTGKTFLLGWILIALIIQAHDAGRPLRIGVSALTHQAINTVLKKVVRLANQYFPGTFPGRCIKWGQPMESVKTDAAGKADVAGKTDVKGKINLGQKSQKSGQDLHGKNDDKNNKGMEVEFTNDTGDAEEILSHPWLIIGATGYGFYTLFNSKDIGFYPILDWIIFDEASQVPVPQALLGLLYNRGNFLFTGDVNQLPPIVLGDYGELKTNDQSKNSKKKSSLGVSLCLNRSILANFLELYPASHAVTLNTTYRMNKEICEFPGRLWYKSMLHPDANVAHARLALNKPLQDLHGINMTSPNFETMNYEYDTIIDPSKPVMLVLTDHRGCSQQSDVEADLMAALAHRLITFYGVSSDRMALISPHRAQNNAIIKRLGEMLEKNHCKLPLVDTVERVQGEERDIIIYGITSSDPDYLLSDFLNSPQRLNVAMTRAKTKLIIIGSDAFFSVIPSSESMLEKNRCFKELMTHCKRQNAVFYFHRTACPIPACE